MPDPAYLFGPARARRPNVMARQHVVVSGHYYASLAGLQILEAGGNAIDAGVATGLAIDVLESEFVGFGGVAPGDDPSGRTRRTACDQRCRRLAAHSQPRILSQTPWRAHPRGPAAQRGSRRAQHLDHGAGALRHDVVRRGRGGGDPFRARRFPDLSVLRRAGRGAAGQLQTLAEHRGDLPARMASLQRWARSSCRATSDARCNTWPTRSTRMRPAIGWRD